MWATYDNRVMITPPQQTEHEGHALAHQRAKKA
jgi:hypothetical protein